MLARIPFWGWYVMIPRVVPGVQPRRVQHMAHVG